MTTLSSSYRLVVFTNRRVPVSFFGGRTRVRARRRMYREIRSGKSERPENAVAVPNEGNIDLFFFFFFVSQTLHFNPTVIETERRRRRGEGKRERERERKRVSYCVAAKGRPHARAHSNTMEESFSGRHDAAAAAYNNRALSVSRCTLHATVYYTIINVHGGQLLVTRARLSAGSSKKQTFFLMTYQYGVCVPTTMRPTIIWAARPNRFVRIRAASRARFSF